MVEGVAEDSGDLAEEVWGVEAAADSEDSAGGRLEEGEVDHDGKYQDITSKNQIDSKSPISNTHI